MNKILDNLNELYANNPALGVLIGLGLIFLFAFLLTRVTKPLKLPNVTAYIFTGVILGPVFRGIFKGQNILYPEMMKGMEFITDIALTFIAFGVGRFLKFDILKKSGPKIVIITLFESLMASVLVFVAMRYIFHLQWQLSLLLAAIASATAPASTMMTIRQTKAKGDFVNTILQVVTLDDAISLLLFSVSIAIITAGSGTNGDSLNFWLLAKPIVLNLVLVVIGYGLGIALHFIINKKGRSTDNRLLLTITMLIIFAAISGLLDISPLLGVMAMGMAYVNFSGDESIFKQLDYFSPPILILFFVVSGHRLQLESLLTMGVAGIVYFIVRIIGKYAGTSLGSVVARSTPENKKYLGLALIPQAGVSLGLAALGARTLIQYGFDDFADILTTIIIASGVLYEIFGPPSAKLSLYLAKAYDIEPKIEPLIDEDEEE